MNNSVRNTVNIAYSRIPERIDIFKWNELIERVPKDTQNKIFKYSRIQDRNRFLTGRLLLKYLMEKNFELKPSDILSRIKFTEYGRPFFSDDIDFNISHSGNIVVCVAVASGKVGIDVELIKPINVDEFIQTLTTNQLKLINESWNPLKMFFKIWTMKESLMKAIGVGLQMSLTEIDSDFKTFEYRSRTFYLQEIFIDPGYCCFIATDVKNYDFNIQEVAF